MLPPDNIPYLFIANWKMYFSNKEASLWAATHFKSIAQLQQNKNISFVVCPSFDALESVASYIHPPALFLGAQDCSAYTSGAYTGQVAARSLAELGCTYCIIGHSETRTYYQVNDDEIRKKMQQLFNNNIIPIICIGETKKEYEQAQTLEVLQKQIEPLADLLKATTKIPYIAYEPRWAIGTKLVPSRNHLEQVYDVLASLCSSLGITRYRFIYGGSIDETTVGQINEISHIQGVLVGRASTNFQKVKTIVSLIKKD